MAAPTTTPHSTWNDADEEKSFSRRGAAKNRCDMKDLTMYVLGAVSFVLATVSSVVSFCARRLQTSNVDLLMNWTKSEEQLAASQATVVSLRADLSASLAREERTATTMETTLSRAPSYATALSACSHVTAAGQ